MIFQDPSSSLNPVLSHRPAARRGAAACIAAWAARRRAPRPRRLLDRVGIADATRRLRDYPHELSGGMNQRVMIAMALAGQPQIC